MFAKSKSLVRGLFNLHKDEDGMEAIQVVAIVAIAAIVLIFVTGTLWPRVQSHATNQVSTLTSN